MWREKQPYPVVKICRRDHPRWVTAHKNKHKMSDTTKNKHKVTDTQFSVKHRFLIVRKVHPFVIIEKIKRGCYLKDGCGVSCCV